jgi:L-alanine-DL-glutamate epimerase-like enolase superfamily enzyme
MHPLRIEQNTQLMDSVVEGNTAAKAAVDMALHDILAKTAGKPLFMLMGGYRTQVLTSITLTIKSPKEMAEDATRAIEKGFKALKVKVGVNPVQDIKRIELIRKAIGEDIDLRIDANQGWTTKQAIKVLRKMEKFDIQFVEQPVESIRGLTEVKSKSSIPVMADESVHSPNDALRLIQMEAVDLMNIKLMKSGGMLKGKKIAHIAEAGGIPCMIGCMVESQIGITMATHLAAALKNIQYADLDSDHLFRDRLVEKGGTQVKNSFRTFPNQNGSEIRKLNNQLLGKSKRIYR